MGTASRLLSAVLGLLRPPASPPKPAQQSSVAGTRRGTPDSAAQRPPVGGTRRGSPQQPAQRASSARETETVEVDPPRRLTLSYAPERDDAPDGGEIVWTWVPYEERDGRGKDRPVLVIGRADATHSYAVRLTSKPHDGDRHYLALGTGEWDPQRRPSWIDVEQLYLVHDAGMRREGAALDRKRFDAVAAALGTRYGWTRG